jgi:hypothetical protein
MYSNASLRMWAVFLECPTLCWDSKGRFKNSLLDSGCCSTYLIIVLVHGLAGRHIVAEGPQACEVENKWAGWKIRGQNEKQVGGMERRLQGAAAFFMKDRSSSSRALLSQLKQKAISGLARLTGQCHQNAGFMRRTRITLYTSGMHMAKTANIDVDAFFENSNQESSIGVLAGA